MSDHDLTTCPDCEGNGFDESCSPCYQCGTFGTLTVRQARERDQRIAAHLEAQESYPGGDDGYAWDHQDVPEFDFEVTFPIGVDDDDCLPF